MKLRSNLSIDGLSAAETNRFLRIQLAAAHRGLAEYDMSDRIINHLSVRSPAANGQGEIILLTPFPVDFKEVTPSSLLGIDLETGDVVEGDGSLHLISGSFHRGFYLGRPDTKCMMHTHSPYICALASLENPTLLMLNQTALKLYGKIEYDFDFGGLVADLNEGIRLGSLLGSDYSNLIMMHHGSLSIGNCIPEAFNNQIALEISAKNQILAMQTGRKLQEISREMCELTATQIIQVNSTGLEDAHLLSLIRKLEKTEPEFIF